MHIGIDASAWHNQRGLGRYLRSIAKHLAEQPEVDLTLFAPMELGEAKPTYCSAVEDSGLGPWLSWRLPRLVRQNPVDVMFFPTNDAWWHGPAPMVVTVHDLAAVHFADRIFRSRWEAWLEIARLRHTVRQASMIVTDSAATKDDLVQTLGCPADKVTPVPLAVSPPFLCPSSVSIEEMQATIGLPSRPYILYAGGLDFRKNVSALIEAFRSLVPEHPEHMLILVGEYGANRRYYPDLDPLLHSPELAGRALRLSNVNDERLHALYTHADLFVFPSLFEGFGLPPLEAMACGTPVVCSNAASLPEVVGDAAELVDARRAENLADGMRRVLGNPAWATELRQRGLARAKQFSWEKAAEQLVEALRAN